MDDQNKNLILATALSFAVILGWFVLFPPPETPVQPATTEQATPGVPATAGSADGSSAPTADTLGAQAVADAPRVRIETPELEGSLALVGGRIDDLSLRSYRETLDDNSPIARLLTPLGEERPYYALFGWAPGAGMTGADVPGPETEWVLESGQTLTPSAKVTLRWDSPSGLIFRRTISVDDSYMFTIDQVVENPGTEAKRAAPYGFIARHGLPELRKFFILHEGVVGLANDTLVLEKYSNLEDFDFDPTLGARAEIVESTGPSWIGFTDHYWMTILIPEAGSNPKEIMLFQEGSNIYQTQTIYPSLDILPGQTVTHSSRFFAGAKVWEVIRDYQNEEDVPRFVDTIDWGWFFFLTKPIFIVLHWLNGLIGNMGFSIIALTLLLKVLVFPLAYKSYASMAKMKELQPEMEKLKERSGDDRQKMQKEMMELYKREKVNPAAGCLPILIQIPIFFSLYKVIFVAFELRQAPWFGPFQDLSAPDPTSIMNLFGLLPFAGPEPGSIPALVFIGILPLLLGISMWLQQKLNPAPTDPTQQMIFAWMPWVFMFMLGGFASGLVVYWITNNTITFIQQYIIMKRHGYTPDVFGNILSTFRKDKDGAKAANKTTKPGGSGGKPGGKPTGKKS